MSQRSWVLAIFLLACPAAAPAPPIAEGGAAPPRTVGSTGLGAEDNGPAIEPGACTDSWDQDHQGQRYAIQLKTVSMPRTVALVGTLAVALLDIRKDAPAVPGAKPLVVVGSRVVTPDQVERLGALMERHGRGLAWGVVDSTGLLELHVPGEPTLHQQRRPRRGRSLVTPAFNPFSDLGQWALKRLVNHRLPAALQLQDTSPAHLRDRPFETATELARASAGPDGRLRVSVAQASKLVAHLRTTGFLADGRPLEVLRCEELLRRWRAATVARPARELGARWLLPLENPEGPPPRPGSRTGARAWGSSRPAPVSATGSSRASLRISTCATSPTRRCAASASCRPSPARASTSSSASRRFPNPSFKPHCSPVECR